MWNKPSFWEGGKKIDKPDIKRRNEGGWEENIAEWSSRKAQK